MIELLRSAQAYLRPKLHRTPLVHSATLSGRYGRPIYLKAELFQKTGSYKPRGMLWAVSRLPEEVRARGVLTFSAGNAAQGLAFAAQQADIRSVVVMPATASKIKAAATRQYGAEVVLHGTPQECLAYARGLATEQGLTFISSYDNDDLMDGHASMGLEIIDDLPDVAAILVAIGGGGMAGGLARALQASGSMARLVGIEPEGAPAMLQSLASGHAVALSSINTIADGLAAPGAGELCFAAVRDRIETVLLVQDHKIIDAMIWLMQRCKWVAEPAGAAALAGLEIYLRDSQLPPGAPVAVVISGGNLDLDRLHELLQPAL
jgi:threonine dehydratase